MKSFAQTFAVVLAIVVLGAWLMPCAYGQTSSQFLVGWYSQISHPEWLAGHAAAGSNVIVPYNGAWSPSSIKPYLDEAQLRGIKVMVDLRVDSLALPEAQYRQIIRDNKNHPALYGWYISDEPELWGTSPSIVNQYYTWTKSEDPGHPALIAHCQVASPDYLNGYDQLMLDYYPGWTLYDGNLFNWMVRGSYNRWQDGIAFAKQYNRPFFAVGLGFGANQDGTPNNGTRDLNYDEYRFHVFSAIVQGVTGFLFWEDDWANTRVKPIIEQMIGQIKAIGAQMRIGVGVTGDSQITVSQPSTKIVYRHGVNGSEHVILAVNISGYATTNSGETLSNIRVTLPAAASPARVDVLNENRSITLSGNYFTDNFRPFEVHVYRYALGTAPAGPSNLRITTAP